MELLQVAAPQILFFTLHNFMERLFQVCGQLQLCKNSQTDKHLTAELMYVT